MERGGALPYLKVVGNVCASDPPLDIFIFVLIPILDLGSYMIFDLVDLLFLIYFDPSFS